MPRLVHFLQCAFRGRGGFWNATDPPDLGVIIALHIGLAVSATVKNGDPLLMLFWQVFAHLRHDLLHRCTQMLFIGAIAVQWAQKDGNIPIMGAGQCEHPLFQILAVIP